MRSAGCQRIAASAAKTASFARRRRCRAILRIERRGEDARRSPASTMFVDRRGDARIAVAHRVIDMLTSGRRVAQRFGLAPRDDAQRRAFIGPHLVVGFGRFARPCSQDDPVQDRLPGDRRDLDDARVAEEFGEIAPHRARLRRVGRAEVDQQDADLRRPARRDDRGGRHAAAIGSNGKRAHALAGAGEDRIGDGRRERRSCRAR